MPRLKFLIPYSPIDEFSENGVPKNTRHGGILYGVFFNEIRECSFT